MIDDDSDCGRCGYMHDSDSMVPLNSQPAYFVDFPETFRGLEGREVVNLMNLNVRSHINIF